MRVYNPEQFVTAWGAIDIERVENASVRLHWTNEAYIWHLNDGPEALVVVDGCVDMLVRGEGEEQVVRLNKGEAATWRRAGARVPPRRPRLAHLTPPR